MDSITYASDLSSICYLYFLSTSMCNGLNFMHDESGKAKMNLQLNVTNKSYLEDDSAPAYADGAKDQLQVMAQLKWRFFNTLN